MPSLPLFAISTACPLNSSTLQGGKYNCRGLLRVSPEPAGVYNRPVPMPIRKKVQSRAFRAVKGLSFLLATSVLVLASPARGDDSATEQARQCYETGTQQYDLGHWDDAIREFEKAYQLRPDPSFLYNLAQAYRRKGDTKRALDLYRNYLAKIPKSPQRAEIEERIKTLQKQIDEEASAKSAPPEPTGRAPVPPPALPLGTGLVPAPAEAPATSVPQADPGMTPGTLPSTTPLPAHRPAQPGCSDHQRNNEWAGPQRGRRNCQSARSARTRPSHSGNRLRRGRGRRPEHGHCFWDKGEEPVKQGRRRQLVQPVG